MPGTDARSSALARQNCRYDRSVQDLDGRVEDVAGAAFGLDVFRLRWVRLDLATQPQDLDVDRAIVDFRVVQTRKIEKLFARKDPLGRGAECLQQAEFAVGQLHALEIGRASC